MIHLHIKNPKENPLCNNLEYDLRAIVKAFYPARDIVYICEDKPYMDIELICDDKVILHIRKDSDNIIFKEFEIDDNIKDRFDIALYEGLVAFNGYDLPWGILTGKRPTKIVYGLIDQGFGDNEAADYLMEKYRVSSKKAALAVKIAKKEKRLLDTIDFVNGYSLYIGIPFCPTTCLYCSFTSFPITLWEKRVDEYLNALFLELGYVSERMKDFKLDSIYIGGGTPTTLTPAQLDRLISKIKDLFNTENILEFTVEAGRPDSITYEKLITLKKHGIDRISINPQTMNQKTLDIIGRRHSVEDVKKSFELARQCGFSNINMDIILGLPGEDREDVINTLEEIKKLSSDSLTVHSLALKRASRLNIKKEDYKELKVVNNDEIIELAGQYAKSLGLEPYYMYRQKNMAGNYENVGYSRQGKEGIYNILIMEEKQTIVACGAGASSKLVFMQGGRIERVENVKDVKTYIEKIDEMIERKKKGFDLLFKESES